MATEIDARIKRLSTRAEFEKYAENARSRWDALWGGKSTIVSVGVGSSSIAKGALDVLDAAKSLANDSVVVRQVAVDGADWAEVMVQVKRPDQPTVFYANVDPSEVADIVAGRRQEKAIGVEGDKAIGNIPPLNSLPFYKYQKRIVLADVGVIDPDSIGSDRARCVQRLSQSPF